MDRPNVSVVIPAYNEFERIASTIEAVHGYMSASGRSFEIIVVDDGSADGTPGLVARMQGSMPELRLVEYGVNRGKGFAVKTGFLAAKGELILFSDADLSTPIAEFGRLLAEVEAGADIAIGSRAMKGSKITRHQPIHRELMGKTFNLILRILNLSGFSDTQCGFKLFRADACLPLFKAQRVERFAFDAEILFLASVAGLSVAQVPVEWLNSPNSRVRIVRDSLRMLYDILRVRLCHMAGCYDKALR